MSRHGDPEEARKIIDPVLTHMMDAVHRFEGTVNQVMTASWRGSARRSPTKTTPSARANSKTPHRRLRLHRKSRRLVSSCSKASPCSPGPVSLRRREGRCRRSARTLVASLLRQGMFERTDTPLHRTPINTAPLAAAPPPPLFTAWNADLGL
jgi:hypothetical protein